MGTPGSTGAPGPQSDQQQLMSPQAGQQVQMGTMPTGAFQPTILSSPMGQQQQYVMVVNQHGQQVLQPAPQIFPGMTTMPTQQQQPGQYIINMPSTAKQGAQQPQLTSQGNGKAMSQAPTYTVPQAGAGGGQTFMITQQMGGSPTTLQATPQNIMPNVSLPSHIKAEPGKSLPPNQPTSVTPQGQQVGTQQQVILPQGVSYINPGVQGQVFVANGQIYQMSTRGPQDGQAATSQIMFSPQGLQMQAHPQAANNLQQNLTTQQLPPGLTTSMQPMTMTSTTSGGQTMVRPPIAYPSQPPVGKTQISRAPPTLLPATSTTANPTSRSTTSTAFMTQPSPKSKQKMSPRTATPLAAKGGLSATSAATKSILNTIKNQSMNASSPPLLSSSGSPMTLSTPTSGGPPVLQTPLSAPPSQASNSQPPLLHPMMIPSSASNPAPTPTSYFNGKPTSIVTNTSLSTTAPGGFKSTSEKVPILPNNNIKKATTAAPMEPMTKNSIEPAKRPQECLTHVIDGHVIHESSQPFPLEDDLKSK